MKSDGHRRSSRRAVLGGIDRAATRGVVMSGQAAVVKKGRSADLRCDERYT